MTKQKWGPELNHEGHQNIYTSSLPGESVRGASEQPVQLGIVGSKGAPRPSERDGGFWDQELQQCREGEGSVLKLVCLSITSLTSRYHGS
ncbi:hypothetical protein OJAV_G00111240 [Oryzias javanicus]|uniref:Uncharacterized protein n=1 Tax=Oryzias javanicus TaxID=123683 RepID=A0A437CWB1_ORYJA|nr:hypothetical protein OJAV_G00111240 [Oryzias javanicus]